LFPKGRSTERFEVKVVLDGLCAAVENQLHLMKGPQVERDPINRLEAEARGPPLDPLRYCVIRVQDSQPKALNHRL
jgi:hypothetical protein